MDVVLGVAVTGPRACLVLVGSGAQGADVIDESVVVLAGNPMQKLTETVVGTNRLLADENHRLLATRLYWSDPLSADRLRQALEDSGIQNVAVLSETQAAGALSGVGAPRRVCGRMTTPPSRWPGRGLGGGAGRGRHGDGPRGCIGRGRDRDGPHGWVDRRRDGDGLHGWVDRGRDGDGPHGTGDAIDGPGGTGAGVLDGRRLRPAPDGVADRARRRRRRENRPRGSRLKTAWCDGRRPRRSGRRFGRSFDARRARRRRLRCVQALGGRAAEATRSKR